MEIALSAFLGEIASRSISFFIGKLSKDKAEAPYSLPSVEDLRRKLLRVRIVVQEAERRQIRSQAMLEQLKILQAGMYRGHYALDASKYDDQGKDDTVSHCSFAISKFNPAKRIQLCTSCGRSSCQYDGEKTKLRQVLGSLEIIITDAAEFLVFLKRCPPLYRCLYSTYLNLENCMFHRHVEMEHVVNFLLVAQKYSPTGCSTEDHHHPDVLPIVGPAKSGKTTLIEHVCNDERVHRAFSRIVFFTEDDLDERISTRVRGGGGGRVKYQRHASSKRGESTLAVVEVNGDISQAAWSSLTQWSASGRCARTNGVTKIIICRRSDKIVRFGTIGALKVGFLTQEAYWYFFKALVFGSMNPEEEPELGSLAMEIATCLKRSFIAGNAIARMLRDNLSAEFWRMTLSCLKEVNQRYPFVLEAHPVTSPSQDRKQIPRLNGSKEYCTIFNGYQTVSAQDEAPMITFAEVLLGRVVLRGKSDILAWRSTIPPYCSYTLSCEIHVVS